MDLAKWYKWKYEDLHKLVQQELIQDNPNNFFFNVWLWNKHILHGAVAKERWHHRHSFHHLPGWLRVWFTAQRKHISRCGTTTGRTMFSSVSIQLWKLSSAKKLTERERRRGTESEVKHDWSVASVPPLTPQKQHSLPAGAFSSIQPDVDSTFI